MNKTRTENIIEEYQKRVQIMQAYLDGEDIEYRTSNKEWYSTSSPIWDWATKEYRVKPKVPDSIDWSQVDPAYKFMARDKNHGVYLYENRPIKRYEYWENDIGECANAKAFNSLKLGNTSWENSLVERPKPICMVGLFHDVKTNNLPY